MSESEHIQFKHEIADVEFDIDCLIVPAMDDKPAYSDETLISLTLPNATVIPFDFDGYHVSDGPDKTITILEQLEQIAIDKYLIEKGE